MVAAGGKNAENMQDTLATAEELLKKTRMASDRKQLQLKDNEAKILDWKGKLNVCSDNREYQTLLEQVAAAEMANSVLSDEILEMFDRVDEIELSVASAKGNLEKSQGDLEKVKNTVSEQEGTLNSEVDRLQAELSQVEQDLPGDVRNEYQRLVRARGEDALAAVENECCDGCYQKITPQMYNESVMSMPVFCLSCGRLLYLPEDRTV